MPVNSAEAFPFDWENDVGLSKPWYVPNLEDETVNEELLISSAKFRADSVASGKVATLTTKCVGATDPVIKIFDSNGDELTEFVRTNINVNSDGSITFSNIWTVTGTRGEVLYYTICVLDEDGAYASNYLIRNITIK